ncbi:unnamed protein product [Durusdinium trenchii]|uniref:Replication factor C subunit 3 (Activator 1 38 kDa subunit) (A1 38 kDa subunit) (Activator 1 subunit 3) (Replication factor C 38 kDa subunit) (RF-C 38 kDa subunit) (RFC38) n=2 Tax=Durusdinium trenchii TaxID=1381693 RepID=A0ABP0LNW0_9DINO
MAMLWVDKHRPKVLAELDYHRDLSDRLRRIAGSGEMPHILMCGPSGAGKSTRVHALLREIYGSGVDTVKVETKSVAPNPSNPSNTVDIQVVTSNHHLQVTPSDLGRKDRAVVMQLIKEVASHPPLGGHSFKVVVIEEAGALSSEAQAALRRTMERYMKTCRIILLTDGASKIIPPLRSRCLPIRVGAPSTEEIAAVLTKVSIAEGLKLAADLSHKIAEKSGRDMRRAMILLEMMHTQANASSLSKDVAVPSEAWQTAIDKVAKKILQEQTPRMAMEVRGNIYELLLACLPADFILKELVLRLVAEVKNEIVKQKAIAAAAHFNFTMKQGNKDIFHIEAFVINFMRDYRAAMQGGR